MSLITIQTGIAKQYESVTAIMANGDKKVFASGDVVTDYDEALRFLESDDTAIFLSMSCDRFITNNSEEFKWDCGLINERRIVRKDEND